MEQAEHYFEVIVRVCILLIEMAGIVVIVVSMIRGFIGFIRKDEATRIQLAQGIMLGLEFKIGSEVLRSVIVSSWSELGRLGAIILLRSLLTFLLHWEIGEEEKRQREKLEYCQENAKLTVVSGDEAAISETVVQCASLRKEPKA